MTDISENIPTLTDIVQAGDASMLNHFDAHQFHNLQDNSDKHIQPQSHEDDTTEYNIKNIMEVSDVFNNTNAFENSPSEPDEIPSITLTEEQDEHIADEDFSDAMQLILDDNINNESTTDILETSQSDKDILKEKINQAVQEILPTIEEQLKEQLYKQFEL